MGSIDRPRRRSKLTEQEIESLKADIIQRQQLRGVMSENGYEVLSLEFNVNQRTIMRLDQRGPVVAPHAKLPQSEMNAIYRRRQIYWQARKLHDEQFSRKVILERYRVSQKTFVRWMHVAQDEQREINQEVRRAA